MARVFRRLPYLILAAGIAGAAYALIAWIPLINLLITIFFYPNGSIGANTADSVHLLTASLFELRATDALYAGGLSILIGINSAILLFYYRLNRGFPSHFGASAGIVGAISGILGFGCAACGSLFFTALVAAIAGTGLAARVAPDALWLQATGIALLLFSIWRLSRSIAQPNTCPSDAVS